MIIKNTAKLCIILTGCLISTFKSEASNGVDFFDQRYRGWIWFEEKEKRQEDKIKREGLQEQLKQKALRQKAREEVEEFAKELEDLKYMMIRYPTSVEHMKAYKEKEKIMMENAVLLGETVRLTNFLNPELVDHIENPVNLYGRRIKEDMDKKNQNREIADLATKVELFLFFAGSCDYCKQLEPVLNDFTKKYNFKIEAVSLDGTNSKFFKTHHDITLAQELSASGQLEKVPTVFVVTNDGKHRFELIRGAASFTELEEMAILARKHISNMQAINVKELTTHNYEAGKEE